MRAVRRLGPPALLCALAAGLALVRQPGKWTWNTIWAEDGALYITDVLNRSPADTVFRGYAGYIQLLPRLLVLPVRVLPVSWYAGYCAVVAAVLTTLLALLVHRWSEGWVRHRGLRLVVPALIALSPVAFEEVNANLSNLGWPLLVASVWALLAKREGRFDDAVRTAVVVATALSTTLAVLLVPCAIAMAVWRRRRSDIVVAVGLTAAAAVQGVADLFLEQRIRDPSSVGDLPAEVAVRVVGVAAFGVRWTERAWLELGWLLPLAAFAAFVAVLVLSRPKQQDRTRLVVGAALALLAVAFFVVPVWVRGTHGLRMTGDVYSGAGTRYDYVPIILLVSALVILVDGAPRRWLQGLVVAQTAFVILTGLRIPNLREAGPMWSESVANARDACNQGAPEALVPISPGDPWTVIVPCGRLR